MRTPIHRGRFWAFAQPNGTAKAVIMMVMNSRRSMGFDRECLQDGIK